MKLTMVYLAGFVSAYAFSLAMDRWVLTRRYTYMEKAEAEKLRGIRTLLTSSDPELWSTERWRSATRDLRRKP